MTHAEHLLRQHKIKVLSMEEVSPRLEDSFIQIITEEESH
jgi:hypothetical protein